MNIKKLLQRQEIRFLFVGGLNTLVGYGVYALLLYFNLNYLVANTISTVIGIAHSYLWNRFFTFKSKEKASTEIFKFISVYLLSYLIGMGTLYLFTNTMQMSPYLAGFINLFITTLISWFGHKNFSFKKIEFHFHQDKPLKTEWVVLGIIIILLFLCFLYEDILITTNASIVFDKLFFTGNLNNLYLETFKNLPGLFQGTWITYDFPIYIFFGLWNLPLYLYTLITKVGWELSIFNILYAKTFLIFLTGIALVIMNKILTLFNLKKNDKKMYYFLFLSSAFTLMVVAMFAGYDILSIVFTLLGIYYYLKKDHKKFVLFFAIAISLKLFALFIFIPLLLLREKKIGKIILSLLGGISILLIAKLLFYNAPMYIESMSSFENNMFGRLNSSYLVNPFGNISIFITLYVLICCWCYHKNIKDEQLFKLYTMYISLGVFGLFCIFCQIHPQWMILMVPYLIFFLVYNKRDRKINLLLEMAFTVFMMLVLYLAYPHVFTPSLTQFLVLPKIIPIANNVMGLPFLTRLLPYRGIINAIVLATFLYFMWINKPEKIIDQKESEKWEHGLLITRMLIIVPFVLIILFYCFR